MPFSSGLPPMLAVLAVAAGVGGVLLALPLAARRATPGMFAMLVAQACLVVAGALAMRGDDGASSVTSGQVLAAGITILVAAAGLCAWEARRRERALVAAEESSETARVASEALQAKVRRLEEEAQELRRRTRLGEERLAGTGAVLEATVARQRAEIESAAAEVRMRRAAFENAVDPMAIVERETLRVAEANAALRALTGHEAAELGAMHLAEILGGGAARPGRAELVRSVRERGTLVTSVVRRGGREVPVELTAAPVGDGDAVRLLVVLRDASAHVAAEAARAEEIRSLNTRIVLIERAQLEAEARCSEAERSGRALAELSERKDFYLSSVSHELRTPLASIRSFSEILMKHGDTEPAVRREFLGIILKESERLTRLVNDVLDLARIEAGAAKLLRADFDARGVLLDAAASVRGLAAEHEVRVSPRPGDQTLMLRADRDRIQQLLVNLLGNAIKFSPAGSDVEVSVGAGATPDRVRFSVRDHGRGIAPEHLERVFDRFHRADDDTTVEGTGLGLSICREIVTLHGGRIWVQSVVGEGSVFHAELPVATEPEPAARRAKGPVTAEIGVLAARSAREITREITREVARDVSRAAAAAADAGAAEPGAAVPAARSSDRPA